MSEKSSIEKAPNGTRTGLNHAPRTISQLWMGASDSIRLDCRLALALILVLVAYFIFLEWLRPHFFLHDDNASFFLPDFLQTYDTLTKTGSVSEVNYYQYGGEPVIELGQSGALYPPSYICVGLAYFLGDCRWAVDLVIISHFIMGAVGLFVFLRLRGTDPGLAFLAACLWICSPYLLLVCSSGCAFAYTAAYLPWIFCALDQLLQKPGLQSALLLVLPMSLYFYCGVVQIYLYVCLFVFLYGLLHLSHSLKRNCSMLLWAAFAVCGVSILVLPLLLPLVHGFFASADRGKPIAPISALKTSLNWYTFIKAQLVHIEKDSNSGLNSSCYFCPELVLVPLALALLAWQSWSRIFQAGRLWLLALLALLLSTRWYRVLLLFPVFNRFRWPFKLFFFWKFFLLLFIVAGLTAWLETIPVLRHRRLLILAAFSASIMVSATGIVLVHQDNALFSHTQLPSSKSDLAQVINPLKGRAMSVGIFFDDGYSFYRYLGHQYSTVFQIPNIGGYNPLIGQNASSFGMGLRIPNVYLKTISPQIRAELNRKCVRYLLVNPYTDNGRAALQLDGTKVLLSDFERVVLENLQAEPMIVSESGKAYETFTYRGNSLFVPLSGRADTLGISLNQSPYWWCRTDHGAWFQPVYLRDRIWSPVPASGHVLEVRYFDRAFHIGLILSLGLTSLGAAILFIYFRRRHKTSLVL